MDYSDKADDDEELCWLSTRFVLPAREPNQFHCAVSFRCADCQREIYYLLDKQIRFTEAEAKSAAQQWVSWAINEEVPALCLNLWCGCTKPPIHRLRDMTFNDLGYHGWRRLYRVQGEPMKPHLKWEVSFYCVGCMAYLGRYTDPDYFLTEADARRSLLIWEPKSNAALNLFAGRRCVCLKGFGVPASEREPMRQKGIDYLPAQAYDPDTGLFAQKG